MGKLGKQRLQVLRAVRDGEHLSFRALADCNALEREGYIEEVKTGFISCVSLRITDAGRAALQQEGK